MHAKHMLKDRVLQSLQQLLTRPVSNRNDGLHKLKRSQKPVGAQGPHPLRYSITPVTCDQMSSVKCDRRVKML